MFSNPTKLACATAILLGACMLSGVTAQGLPPDPACHYRGLEVMCAPRRITYGYYPTHWRRWPEDHLQAQPTPAAEPVQTPPAEETKPKVEPGQPTITQEDETLFPSEPAPGGTPPSGTQPGGTPPSGVQPTIPQPTSPDPTLPFLDQPPEPPADAPGTTETAPPRTEAMPAPPRESTPAPTQPKAEPQAPPAEDAPPTMPDEDPFRDDPPEPGGDSAPAVPSNPTSAPADTMAPPAAHDLPLPGVPASPPAKPEPEPITGPATATDQQTRRQVPARRTTALHASTRWRAAGTAEAAIAEFEPLTPVPAGKEPGLLPPGDMRVTQRANPLPAVAPAQSNPLRPASASPRRTEVAQTAAWTAERAAMSNAAAISRRNPLRNN